MNYQELKNHALEIIETDINISFESTWTDENKCQNILIIDSKRFFFINKEKLKEYPEEILALKEDKEKDFNIIFYDTVSPYDITGQLIYILTDTDYKEFTPVTIEGKVIKDNIYCGDGHIKNIIKKSKIAKSLTGRHQGKFNEFQELIADTFTWIDHDIIYHLLNDGSKINSLYFEESYLFAKLHGLDYIKEEDPDFIQSFKLIKDKGKDPLQYKFIDLISDFYRDKLYKKTAHKFAQINKSWEELRELAIATKQ